MKGVQNIGRETLEGARSVTESVANKTLEWARSLWDWRRYASIALTVGLVFVSVLAMRRIEPARLRAGRHF
jgi:hypothetical protein